MITLNLDTKKCMSALLLHGDFDSFYFIEGEITTYNTFAIDGRIHKPFFEDPPEEEYSYWSRLKEHCFTIIRGKRTPLSFKLILSLSAKDIPLFLNEQDIPYRPEDIQGLYLNLRYDGTALQCITGTSMRTFTLDKSLDATWDVYVRRFLDRCGVGFEEA